jgi:hypothetical protein
MKKLTLLVSLGTISIRLLAADATTNAASAVASTTNKIAAPIMTFLVSTGAISKPFVLDNEYVSQPEQTDETAGGKVSFSFMIANAGSYVLQGLVNAPSEDANSFYINIDAPSEDPLTIWDIEVTNGFEQRLVSWRGNGGADSDEFSPKRFQLSAGQHKLTIVGREAGAELKSVSLCPAGH